MATMTKPKINKAVKAVRAVGAPTSLVKAVEDVAHDPSMNDVMAMTSEHMDKFTSPAAAIFAGIGLNELARREIDQVIDNVFRQNGERLIRKGVAQQELDEPNVVIGSGPHAAIYAAAKVAAGGSRPLVLEKNDRAGGVFAVTRGPAFFLNSRNRQGSLAPPGVAGGALNVLPMSPVQPVDLGGQEYQSNDQLAFATRITLALYADVATGVEAGPLIEGYSSSSGYVPSFFARQEDDNLFAIRSKVTIIATGLGQEKRVATSTVSSDRVLTYSQFMAKLDDPLPLAGLGRVAVIGAGDGGKTVIEALVGQGPKSIVMLPALGQPEAIDWYGAINPEDGAPYASRGEWESCNRSRYRGIGRALARDNDDDTALVRPRERAATAVEGNDVVYINGRPYDTVIEATGYSTQTGTVAGGYSLGSQLVGGRALTSRYSYDANRFIATIGPASNLALEQYERQVLPVDVGENTVALWRYADRTATIATQVARQEVR